MRNSVVIGAGGQARVIVSLLLETNAKEGITVIDIGESRPGETILGVSVRPERDLEVLCVPGADVFLALGDGTVRASWYERTRQMGCGLPNLISKFARIADDVSLGDANVICAHAVLGPSASIGNNNLINTSAVVEHEVIVGHHCHIGVGVVIAGRTKIGNGVTVGAGSVIIDKLSVADGSTIGAATLVIRDIAEPDGTHVGSPSRRIR